AAPAPLPAAKQALVDRSTAAEPAQQTAREHTKPAVDARPCAAEPAQTTDHTAAGPAVALGPCAAAPAQTTACALCRPAHGAVASRIARTRLRGRAARTDWPCAATR